LYYIVPSEATQQSCGVPHEAKAAGGSLVSIDIDAFRVVKVRAMRQHKSQNPLPFREGLKDAAAKLTCHEVFRLARPISTDNRNGPRDDLFSGMDDQLRSNGYIIGESLC
jgi:LmbE family N-acetylglucosaminyl deacetylase